MTADRHPAPPSPSTNTVSHQTMCLTRSSTCPAALKHTSLYLHACDASNLCTCLLLHSQQTAQRCPQLEKRLLQAERQHTRPHISQQVHSQAPQHTMRHHTTCSGPVSPVANTCRGTKPAPAISTRGRRHFSRHPPPMCRQHATPAPHLQPQRQSTKASCKRMLLLPLL
jgi:hypothetical protein